VGIAHRGADNLVAEQFLNFPQILCHVLSRIVAAEWRNPWAVISPTPERAACETNTESVDDTQHQRLHVSV
jgi:hypothetical protein